LGSVIKDLYGAGILFFYYIKYIIIIGWPLLLYGLDYKPNMIMDLLWVYCMALATKDFIMRFVFKKKYCTIDKCDRDKV